MWGSMSTLLARPSSLSQGDENASPLLGLVLQQLPAAFALAETTFDVMAMPRVSAALGRDGPVWLPSLVAQFDCPV